MLQVEQLTRRFGDHTAVDNVSFDVPDGQLIGFVGGNGAGKTTTMRMIMGVLAIHGGQVLVNGRPITLADRKTFGYMPEERGLYPKQRIIDQLVYLGRLHGMSQKAARASATDHLERFGLGERAQDHVEKLSLGNQQRVQIIAAVMAQPTALVLDEPFSGLDPTAVDQMAAVLREHSRRGVPILFSSHQLDLVERLCDGLVILARGKVVGKGTADQLRGDAPVRHRLVLDGDAGWTRDLPGLYVADVEGNTAVLEVMTPGAERELLEHALRRGSIREFARIVPPLSEIYREVTADAHNVHDGDHALDFAGDKAKEFSA
ncbi:ABC-2 type transport system ATP-binding protein [Kineosphaera limosa]|uniref:Putative ABC transporter ATP-binding protein n=1 Tax=Kineosphaera limosa NBRC 100340 TaxID=1184609 RepID=K6VKE1_9MICO|nr:ATP-binding cassette domain-containing protein [Kineosphaera limosa]NYE01536.1 ABC-2 type transport system ATP-binding protein [Kineosphaera limosa]GAB96693.1 putative ABC transporter ATP-binding protein [Kineosphaera limosa NBRC 100340]